MYIDEDTNVVHTKTCFGTRIVHRISIEDESITIKLNDRRLTPTVNKLVRIVNGQLSKNQRIYLTNVWVVERVPAFFERMALANAKTEMADRLFGWCQNK